MSTKKTYYIIERTIEGKLCQRCKGVWRWTNKRGFEERCSNCVEGVVKTEHTTETTLIEALTAGGVLIESLTKMGLLAPQQK